MAEVNSSRLRGLLAKTTGPAPWYWNTFPTMHSANGGKLAWSHHGEQGPLAHIVTLNFEGNPDEPLLALNAYCRPFKLGDSRIGLWCPEGRSIRFVCFDTESLKRFDLAEIAGWFKQSSDRIYAAEAPVAEFEIPLALEAGTHHIDVPIEMRELDEFIVPTSYPAEGDDYAAYALYVLYPHAGLAEVLPQRWFTRSQYQVGKQWITKAVRDAESQLILGECFGVGMFLLQEDGCRLERWIDRGP